MESLPLMSVDQIASQCVCVEMEGEWRGIEFLIFPVLAIWAIGFTIIDKNFK